MNESSFSLYSPEAQRLATQAQGLAMSTRRFLATIGVKPGMKVLDVGSGAGDTAFLLAEYVGPEGNVIGIDKKPDLVTAARERARAAKLHNVHFIEGDIFTAPLDNDFDMIYGRLVLIHVQEHVALLRRLAQQVHTRGIIAFQESDFTIPSMGLPDAPLFKQTVDWIQAIFKHSGKETQMALRLHRLFLDAGLPLPTVILEQEVIGPGVTPSTELMKALSPNISESGIASAKEIGIETLDQRMHSEAQQRQGAVLGRGLANAWTCKI